jgi:nanoRNase/pAp phosphatase (c-di-AMP/oligoRNAs hydrolase)
VLHRFQIENPFTRNIVLAILTGIIGDTNMGRFIKSRREKTYYNLFSTMFNRMLAEKTVKETNFKDIGEVFGELQRLSAEEDRCYAYFDDRKRFSDSIGYVALNAADMESLLDFCDMETVVSVARAMANDLAEQSGKLSLVSYYDVPSESDLVQFRVRRQHDYKKYDLRNILEILSIENGGGHEGAIGFRVPQGRIDDYGGYLEHMIGEIERVIP